MKKRADGRYCKQVLIGYFPNGKRKFKTIYGQTKKEVEKKEREIKDSIDKGVFDIINNDVSVSEWADEWLVTYKSGLSYNTYARCKDVVRIHIKPNIGHYKLNQVKLVTIQKLINSLENYSLSTIKKVRDAIHQMYVAAIANEMAQRDPTVGLVLPKKQVGERDAVSEDVAKNIVDFGQKYEIGIMGMFLLYTGLRRGELVALTWKDIDMKTKTISVNKSCIFKVNQPCIAPPKTKYGFRDVPILDALYKVLQPYREKCMFRYGIKNIDETPVFPNSSGKIHSATTIKKLWTKYLKELNAEYGTEYNFGMHQLRHTFCTLLYKAESDIKTAQAIMGHSDISITLKIYTHLDQKQKNSSIAKLNAFVNEECFG